MRKSKTINGQRTLFDGLSALGAPLVAYPEDSLLTTQGCGADDCFTCASLSCQIRVENRYCRYAMLGNPFPCKTIKKYLRNRNDCQFINNTLAFHRPGDGRPSPCCMECENKCEYRCERSVQHNGQNKN